VRRVPDRQVEDALLFQAPARHAVEDETAAKRKPGQEHEPGRENRGRKARHQPGFQVGRNQGQPEDEGSDAEDRSEDP